MKLNVPTAVVKMLVYITKKVKILFQMGYILNGEQRAMIAVMVFPYTKNMN